MTTQAQRLPCRRQSETLLNEIFNSTEPVPKNMLKHFILSLALLILWQSWSFAEVPMQFFIEGVLHQASVEGTVQWSEIGVRGTEIDLDGVFGFGDTTALTGKAGILIQDRHEFLLDYRRYHFSEDSTLATSIQFGGTTIPSHLPISPELTFRTLGLFYGYRFLDPDSGYFSIRPGLELVDYGVEVSSNLFGFQLGTVSYAESRVVPFVLFAGEYRFHPLISLVGEFSGGWIDERAGYLVQPMLKINPYPNISALIGYSQVWYRDETDGNLFEVTLSGVVVGIQAVW